MRYYYELDDESLLSSEFVKSRLGIKFCPEGNKVYLSDESAAKLSNMNREQRFTMKAWRIWPKEEE